MLINYYSKHIVNYLFNMVICLILYSWSSYCIMSDYKDIVRLRLLVSKWFRKNIEFSTEEQTNFDAHMINEIDNLVKSPE